MKDSGVGYLGDIPQNWDITRGKHVLRLLQRPIRDDDGVITCFRDGEVTLRSNRRTDGFTVSLKEIGYQGIEPGDLVVHGMDGFAGAIGISDSRGKASPVLNVMDSTEDKRFLMYYLRALAFREVYLALADGIRVRSCNLSWKKIGNLPVAIPSSDEQRRIADYLDAKCAEIDRAIEAAERSIEELTNYRRAVVSKVLHWEDWPMTHVGVVTTKVGSGKTPRGGREVYVSEGVPIIRSQNVRDEGIRLDDVAFISEDMDATMASTHVLSGDLLLNITGASIGRSCVAPDDLGIANVNQHVCIVRPVKTMICAEWLHQCWYSEHGQRYVATTQVGATREALNSSQIKAFRIPLPPVSEQKRLSVECDATGTRVDSLIASKQSIIDDLKAYKQSLVYEVVTGKREV